MVHNAVRILVVAGFLAGGWVAGHAQAQAPAPAPTVSSDFELIVATTDDGRTELRCVRGCRLTWAPVGVDMLAPDVRVRGTVNAKGCMSMLRGSDNCRILGWKR